MWLLSAAAMLQPLCQAPRTRVCRGGGWRCCSLCVRFAPKNTKLAIWIAKMEKYGEFNWKMEEWKLVVNPSKKAAASHQSVKNLRGQKKTARRKSKAYAKLRGKKRR